MPSVPPPDRTALSPNRRRRFEARPSANGVVPHPAGDGPPAHYRMLHGDGRVLWERPPAAGEGPPGELLAANDGRAVVMTRGPAPQVIAFGSDGREVARVRVVPPGGDDPGAGLRWMMGAAPDGIPGGLWTAHAWPYFVRVNRTPVFVWRAWWGRRLVLDLAGGSVVDLVTRKLAAGLDRAEARGAVRLFGRLLPHLDAVRGWLAGGPPLDPRLAESVARVTAAAHLVGLYRAREALAGLRAWEAVDAAADWAGGLAVGAGWWVERQAYRPIIHHALRCLGEVPAGGPNFQFLRDHPDGDRMTLPPSPPDRAAKLAAVGRGWTARRVLECVGPPDHIGRPSSPSAKPPYVYAEPWEYDHLTPAGWQTWRLMWHDEALASSGPAPAGTATSAGRAADILAG